MPRSTTVWAAAFVLVSLSGSGPLLTTAEAMPAPGPKETGNRPRYYFPRHVKRQVVRANETTIAASIPSSTSHSTSSLPTPGSSSERLELRSSDSQSDGFSSFVESLFHGSTDAGLSTSANSIASTNAVDPASTVNNLLLPPSQLTSSSSSSSPASSPNPDAEKPNPINILLPPSEQKPSSSSSSSSAASSPSPDAEKPNPINILLPPSQQTTSSAVSSVLASSSIVATSNSTVISTSSATPTTSSAPVSSEKPTEPTATTTQAGTGGLLPTGPILDPTPSPEPIPEPKPSVPSKPPGLLPGILPLPGVSIGVNVPATSNTPEVGPTGVLPSVIVPASSTSAPTTPTATSAEQRPSTPSAGPPPEVIVQPTPSQATTTSKPAGGLLPGILDPVIGSTGILPVPVVEPTPTSTSKPAEGLLPGVLNPVIGSTGVLPVPVIQPTSTSTASASSPDVPSPRQSSFLGPFIVPGSTGGSSEPKPTQTSTERGGLLPGIIPSTGLLPPIESILKPTSTGGLLPGIFPSTGLLPPIESILKPTSAGGSSEPKPTATTTE
ncbi:hypothetical protein PTT_08816, partial [Pyrenophora teres f. teres 0-1]